jgi:hypothetical protein
MLPDHHKLSLLKRLEGLKPTTTITLSYPDVSGSAPSIGSGQHPNPTLYLEPKRYLPRHQPPLKTLIERLSPPTLKCSTRSIQSKPKQESEVEPLILGNHLLTSLPTQAKMNKMNRSRELGPGEKNGFKGKLNERTQMTMKVLKPRSDDLLSLKPSFPGNPLYRLSNQLCQPIYSRSSSSSTIGPVILPLSSEKFSSPPGALTSHQISGSKLSRVSRWTSTKSSGLITPLRSTQNRPTTSEIFSNSQSSSLGKRDQCEPMENGLSHSPRPLKRSHMSYHPGGVSTLPRKPMSPSSLPLSNLPITNTSLSSTMLPDLESLTKNTYASMVLPTSSICKPCFSPHMVWVPVPASDSGREIELGGGVKAPLGDKTLATIGIATPAAKHLPTVSMNTVVTCTTAVEITDGLTVCKLEWMNERIGEAPRHRWRMIWGKEWDACSKTVK